MKSGLVLCCLLALAAAVPNPFGNDTEPYGNRGNQDIINGRDSKYGFFNYILLLKKNGEFTCAASLISSTRGLTAAHCLALGWTYTVVAGELNRDANDGYEVSRHVKSFVKYPQYVDGKFWKYDIAILKFDSIPNSKYVAPIKRFTAADGDPTTKTCFIAGWGRTSRTSNARANRLQYAHMLVMTTSDCRSRLGNTFIQDSHVCIQKYSDERSACDGDRGGPLECYTGGEYKLVGVSSFTVKNCPPSHPNVYTRVTSYESWIQSNM